MHVVSVTGLSYVGSPTAAKMFDHLVLAFKGTVSVALLAAAMVLVIMGISIPGCTMLGLQSPLVAVCLLLASFLMLAVNEAFQVGCMGIQYMDDAELGGARDIHRLIFPPMDALVSSVDSSAEPGAAAPAPRVNRLKNLFVGQSFLVVTCSFLIAGLTTFDGELFVGALRARHGDSAFLTALSVFVGTGLQGAFVTVILFQLLPSVYAKKRPVQVLSVPGVGLVVRLALLVEAAGVLQSLYLVVGLLDCCFFQQAEAAAPAGMELLLLHDPDAGWPPAAAEEGGEAAEKGEHRQHEVQPCDTMNGLCLRYGVSAVDLRRLNGFSGNQFQGLRTLAVPPPAQAPRAEEHSSVRGRAAAWGPLRPDASAPTSPAASAAEASPCMHRSSCVLLAKYVLSTIFLVLCGVYFLYSLVSGFSAWRAPIVVQGLCLLLALGLIFYCEGLKIAVISTNSNGAPSDGAEGQGSVSPSPIHALLGRRPAGVERFMLGRQQIVVPLSFLVAQITHFSGSMLGFITSNPALDFLLIGVDMPVILLLLVFGQLAPQLLADKHQRTFLELWGSYALVYSALLVESLGIAQATFLLVEAIDMATH